MDKIETMRAFIAVAQEHSFTSAGRRLGISTKLVSKYVQHLEAQLQARLFNRTTRSVSLTEVGAAYLGRCRSILEQIDDLDALVREHQVELAGPIRITAPTGFGSTRLTEALVPFLRAHPDVHLDLQLSDTRVALVEEGLDLAIRIGALRDSTLIARRLADMSLVVSAAPEYLEHHGRPQNPRALSTHTCLVDGNQSNLSAWRFWDDTGQEHVAKLNVTTRANAPAAIARMAMGGLGIARSPHYAVADALKSGQLEEVLPSFRTDTYGVYALYPPNRHLTRRVRALIDHLASEQGRAAMGAQG
ncbi:LysR family transcriptional regulator [Epibacterium sp. SM1969]|uniref:LysR family transcriptional regulator n=1 Tax=Tritonibacter aquimaris TaxID=2663379 RepID=A0A844AXW0_9RHOB|nr:LysR family transcriptional regulator [Tritonibacter aquimaris]MQY44418.1 LysR family transcriptional regulator [Tritonibacter aquimaris]